MDKQAVAELQQIYRGFVGAEKLNAIAVERPDREAYLTSGVANSGDATRGEKLFKDRAGVACINCHRVKGEGVEPRSR